MANVVIVNGRVDPLNVVLLDADLDIRNNLDAHSFLGIDVAALGEGTLGPSPGSAAR